MLLIIVMARKLFFCHGIDDCSLRVEKEGYRSFCKNHYFAPPPKGKSLDRKSLKRNLKKGDKEVEVKFSRIEWEGLGFL